MITHDVRSNIGFDFDVNIEVNDDEDNYSAEEIRKRIYKALNKVAKKYGYDFPEESTRVLTIKLKDRKRKRVIHSCDFAVVYNCDDGRQQYIRYNKQRNNYTWEYTSVGFKNIEEKIEYIKENNLQAELKDIYLYKKNTNTDKNKQIEVFKRQLCIAEKHGMPIIVHSRDSMGDTYNILKRYKLNGVIHCFSGSVEMAREFTKIGYYIGVGGIITYKNAKTIKEVVKDISLSYILLETDSPYLSPEPFRGKVNYPSNIPLIAKAIADIKSVSITDVARVTTSNSESVFDFFRK